MTQNMKWGTTVPLIGGIAVAGKQVTGKDPDFFLSYKPFAENEKNCKAYFPNVPHYLLDEPNFGGFDVAANRDVDFIQALCPCAGLSLLSAGTQEQRDGMNKWMIETAKFVTGQVKPKVFWGENAPALYSKSGERVRNQLREIASENGYSFSVYCTNTMYHGIPQSRKRTFYFFWRDSNAPIFKYYRNPTKNLLDYLDEVPVGVKYHTEEDIKKAEAHLQSNPYIRFLQQKYDGAGIQKMRQFLIDKEMRGTTMLSFMIRNEILEECRDWFEKEGLTRPFNEASRVLKRVQEKGGFWDGSFPIYRGDGTYATLIQRTLLGVHPRDDRVITTRECMHLMGLPHDFELVNGQMNNICQNVPVCTAADMTREVVAFINGEREISNASYLLQSNLSERVDVSQSSLLGF